MPEQMQNLAPAQMASPLLAGMHQPAFSRYKCMCEFMRPAPKFTDGYGNVIYGSSAGRTTCHLPKDHEGPHENCRGELAAVGYQRQISQLNYAEFQAYVKYAKELEARIKKLEEEAKRGPNPAMAEEPPQAP